MKARRSPSCIRRGHREVQIADLMGNSPSATSLSRFAEHRPVQPESGPMPASNRLRHEQKERILPGGPESAGGHPKDLLEQDEYWFGVVAVLNRHLLAKNEILQTQTSVG